MNGSSKHSILITGGCGKIGSYFARSVSGHYTVRIIDKISWDDKTLGPFAGESLIGDLQQVEECRKACCGMDTVIHLAADGSPEADFLTSLLPNNILATYNLFRAAQEAGCQRVVFASSAHVVSAYPSDVQVDINMPVRPKNLYGVTKCLGEALAAYFAFQEGVSSVVLRIGAYLFPNDDISSEDLTAFLHPDDFNQLLLKCVETPDIKFALANAISDNRLKRLDLTETKQLLGYEPQADAFSLFPFILRHERSQ
jgi:nucleoside-diphosphate-sugar epimerase